LLSQQSNNAVVSGSLVVTGSISGSSYLNLPASTVYGNITGSGVSGSFAVFTGTTLITGSKLVVFSGSTQTIFSGSGAGGSIIISHDNTALPSSSANAFMRVNASTSNWVLNPPAGGLFYIGADQGSGLQVDGVIKQGVSSTVFFTGSTTITGSIGFGTGSNFKNATTGSGVVGNAQTIGFLRIKITGSFYSIPYFNV